MGKLGLSMRLAEDNAKELKTVLEHYRKDPDQRKFKAARFLIGNMAIHWSYPEDVLNNYCSSMLEVYENDKTDRIIELTDSLYRIYWPLLTKVYDVQNVSADYLIKNIDYSFKLWDESPYMKHLSFRQFCEFVLPYRCIDGQPLSYWKQEMHFDDESEMNLLQQIYDFRDNARTAVEMANEILRPEVAMEYHNYTKMNLITVPIASYLMKIPLGTCRDKAILGMMNCLANGAPVVYDYSPGWGNRNGSHCWNSVLCTSHRNVDFLPFNMRPGDQHYPDMKHAKVYRYNYSVNKKWLKALAQGYSVSFATSGVNTEDVTAEYVRTANISRKVDRIGGYAYLCVFNRDKWKPVDISKIQLSRACFKNVGLGILYCVTEERNGEQIPLSEPFYLDTRGNITEIHNPEEESFTNIHIKRKFPALSHVFGIRDKLRTAVIEASDNPDFSEPMVIADIPANNLLSGECDVKIEKPYRYWRIRCDDGESHFAEFFFQTEDGTFIHPKIFTSKFGDSPANLIDGDPLTNFAIDKEHNVVFSFARPVCIKNISFIRRGDGNDILPGDEYELYLWKNRTWELCQRKKADSIELEFENVPSGGLYFIKGCSRGSQNRVFEYINDTVVWR